ncbi:MAG: SIR2 family protein [Deltaproteobacteria bacterium]|nr:SIR2 family protein [Deltaproteobacteria bacterium]
MTTGSRANLAQLEVPDALVSDVLAGNCVAFVGAGFTAPAEVPTWQELLLALAKSIGDETSAQIERLLSNQRLVNYQAAAQIMRDKLGDKIYKERLSELVRPQEEPMHERLRWLRGIPFRAVLTTNFDGLLPGSLPGPEIYHDILRPKYHRWWDDRFWRPVGSGSPVVCLHGDLFRDPDTTVLTTSDYRDRLRFDSAYSTFLRAVFATNSVLFLGFSFSDFYLNELRAQILSLFGPNQDGVVTSYALIDDVGDRDVVEYFRRHEGIEILTYATKGRGHAPFDSFLERLHQRTNPKHVLGQRLHHRRVLWVDPHPEHNPEGVNYLSDAATTAGVDFELVFCQAEDDSAFTEHALTLLDEGRLAGQPFDLVISHWGHDAEGDAEGTLCSRAERLLAEMHQRGLRVPVVIFSAPDFANENKPRALRAGAVAFTCRWSELCHTIDEIVGPVWGQ